MLSLSHIGGYVCASWLKLLLLSTTVLQLLLLLLLLHGQFCVGSEKPAVEKSVFHPVSPDTIVPGQPQSAACHAYVNSSCHIFCKKMTCLFLLYWSWLHVCVTWKHAAAAASPPPRKFHVISSAHKVTATFFKSRLNSVWNKTFINTLIWSIELV